MGALRPRLRGQVPLLHPVKVLPYINENLLDYDQSDQAGETYVAPDDARRAATAPAAPGSRTIEQRHLWLLGGTIRERVGKHTENMNLHFPTAVITIFRYKS